MIKYHLNKDMIPRNYIETILGDPGAVSGGGEKSKNGRKEKSGEEKSRRPPVFRLFPAPTNCPWVSEDAQRPSVIYWLIDWLISLTFKDVRRKIFQSVDLKFLLESDNELLVSETQLRFGEEACAGKLPWCWKIGARNSACSTFIVSIYYRDETISTLISIYFRDELNSTLISIYYRDEINAILISIYYRDETISTFISIYFRDEIIMQVKEKHK